MELEITDTVFEWRGPAPYHFVRVPEDEAALIQELATALTYGWGMIPVSVRVGGTEWTTSLWPKDGRYVVPLKDKVRHAERLELGDVVTVRLTIDV
jgi:Domain of unknown function (DUF1905)